MPSGRITVEFVDEDLFSTPLRTIDQIRAERAKGSTWIMEHRAETTLWIAWERWKETTGKAEPFDTWLMRVSDVRETLDPTTATPSEPSPE